MGRTVGCLFLIPTVTGTLAAIFLGERYGPANLAGAALVLAGTALVRLGRGRGRPAGGPEAGKQVGAERRSDAGTA